MWHAPGLAQLLRKMGMMSFLKDNIAVVVLPEHIAPPVAPPEAEPVIPPVETPEAEPEPDMAPDPEPPPVGGGVEEQAVESETQAARERREKTVRGIEKTILSNRNLSRIEAVAASSTPAPSALRYTTTLRSSRPIVPKA